MELIEKQCPQPEESIATPKDGIYHLKKNFLFVDLIKKKKQRGTAGLQPKA